MATADAAKPTYIYKLIPSSDAPPSPLPEALPVSVLDSASGFIHLSTALQVPGTLKAFFKAEPCVHVLRLAYAPLEVQIRWEDPKAEVCGPRGGEGMFPHLYNDLKVGKGEVESMAMWKKEEGEGWDEVLERVKEWLVY
ncbi:hypothetical protein B0H21DRAFT_704959 [Amylocystis lapponica]|nr:hypothetical protein B0H21DRAFT_704959 [Amylocystis lapponica]